MLRINPLQVPIVVVFEGPLPGFNVQEASVQVFLGLLQHFPVALVDEPLVVLHSSLGRCTNVSRLLDYVRCGRDTPGVIVSHEVCWDFTHAVVASRPGSTLLIWFGHRMSLKLL